MTEHGKAMPAMTRAQMEKAMKSGKMSRPMKAAMKFRMKMMEKQGG